MFVSDNSNIWLIMKYDILLNSYTSIGHLKALNYLNLFITLKLIRRMNITQTTATHNPTQHGPS